MKDLLVELCLDLPARMLDALESDWGRIPRHMSSVDSVIGTPGASHLWAVVAGRGSGHHRVWGRASRSVQVKQMGSKGAQGKDSRQAKAESKYRRDVHLVILKGAVVRTPKVVKGPPEVTLARHVRLRGGKVTPWYQRVLMSVWHEVQRCRSLKRRCS